MKIKPTHTTTFSGDFVDLGAMQIDPEQGVKLSIIISGMYSKDYSCVREYISNGKTASHRAGVNKPVEVNLSTFGDNDQFVTITDYGTGMTLEDMKRDLLWLGRSTSDLETDSAGGFGIGAKSGLSVTPQFHISSTKDGVTTNIQIKRDENGISTTLLGQGEAHPDEHGTTVTLPLSQTQMNSMISSIKENLVPFYPEDEVLFFIDGVKIDSGHALVGRRVKDVIISTDGQVSYSRWQQHGHNEPTVENYAIVAGAPYPISFDISQYTNGIPVSVIFLDNEDVTIPSNREGLEPSQLTHDSIKRKMDECHAILADEINKELEDFTLDNLSDFREKISQGGYLISNCELEVKKDGYSRGGYTHRPTMFNLMIDRDRYLVDSSQIMRLGTKTFERFKNNDGGDDIADIENILRNGKNLHSMVEFNYENGKAVQSTFWGRDDEVLVTLTPTRYSWKNENYLSLVKGTPLTNNGSKVIETTLGELHDKGVITLVTKDEYKDIAKRIRSVAAKAYRKENTSKNGAKKNAVRAKSDIDVYINGKEVSYDVKNPLDKTTGRVLIFPEEGDIMPEHHMMCAMGEIIIVRRHGIPTKSIMKFLGREGENPEIVKNIGDSGVWQFRRDTLNGFSITQIHSGIAMIERTIKFSNKVANETSMVTIEKEEIDKYQEIVNNLKKVAKYVPENVDGHGVGIELPFKEGGGLDMFLSIANIAIGKKTGSYSREYYMNQLYNSDPDDEALFKYEDDIIALIKTIDKV